MKYTIGADFGGSSSKMTLLDEGGRVIVTTSYEYPTCYPHNGWAEQAPEDWESFCFQYPELFAKSGISRRMSWRFHWTPRRIPPSA